MGTDAVRITVGTSLGVRAIRTAGMGLTRKILLFTSLLVTALVLITLAFTTWQAESLASASVRRAVLEALDVWEAFQADRYQTLKLGVRVLANDPAFKAAVQTSDPATVHDLLEERGRDLSADFFIATGPTGRVVARSDRADNPAEDLSRDGLLQAPLGGEEAASVWRQGAQLFHAVAVPMSFGEDFVGALVAGYRIDDSLARQIRGMTSSEIAYVAWSGDRPEIAACSLAEALPALRGWLQSPASTTAVNGVAEPFALDLLGARHIAVVRPLRAKGGERLGAVLIFRSLAREMAPFTRFRDSLILVSSVVMVVALVLAYFGSTRITRPLLSLVGHIESVREGTYTGPISATSRDEIGALAGAFDRMRQGIADREEHIRRMALQDPLTLLPNRALFADRLQQVLTRSRRDGSTISTLMLDLEQFKDVNASLGHHAGDEILRSVALRLSSALRASDTVARFEGDQFAVLLPSGGLDNDAKRVARNLIRALEPPITTEGKELHLRANVGIATSPQHGDDAETLIRHADAALNVARRTGAGFAIYDAGYERGPERLWLIEELYQAIEKNELVVHYQPQVELLTGRPVSAEALVRWNHPRRGLLPPSQLIPVAEQTGLITAVTRKVLETAITQCGVWQREGLALGVGVNISARDLLSRELPEALPALLLQAQVDPTRICLEITESTVMEEPEQALAVLKELRDIGVRLSIDDFGTGYSSLAYLRRLPVGELKVDKAFVLGMAIGHEDAAIVRTIIELGHNMGLQVVAEGVETAGSFDDLRALGCDLAQGFYLSGALPPDELSEWLAQRAATITAG